MTVRSNPYHNSGAVRKLRQIIVVALLIICGIATTSTSLLAAPTGPGTPRTQKESSSMTTGFLTRTIKQDNEEYRYVVYVPVDYDGSKAYPTIVFLNGAGECGRDGLKHIATGLGPAVMKAVEKWPFIIVFPQKPDVRKNWEDYDSLVMAMLTTTQKDFKVDSHRIFLTGLSQGGHGTWAIGAKHTDLFAALAPICGWGDNEWSATLKSLPIWAFHGEADAVVPVKRTQDMVEAVKAAGGDVKLTTYPGVGHNSWDNAYSKGDLADWFLQHPKK